MVSKKKFILFILLGYTLFSKGQEIEQLNQNDSVQSQIVEIAPYYSMNKSQAGNYFKVVDDQEVLQFSTGVSVFNALRGQAPALFLPSYFANAGLAGMRTGYFVTTRDAVILIDGVPFNNQISDYYNLNGLDIASISSISNSNAVSFIASTNSGAFIVQSKSAEGLTKPTLEFNSSFSKGFFESPSNGGSPKLNEKYFANSLTYSRDFGKVDTRISYTFLNQPMVYTTPGNIHNLKINTGMQISDKFKVRMILTDQYSRQLITLQARPLPGTMDQADINRITNFFSGNILGQYQVNENLRLTSQIYYSDFVLDSLSTTQQTMITTDHEKENYLVGANLFMNYTKVFSNRNSISAFAGGKLAQQHYSSYLRETQNGGVEFDLMNELTTSSPQLSGGIEFGYKAFLFLKGQFSSGKFKNEFDRDNDQGNYLLSSSFIFSELWRPDFLTFGKVRASYGAQEIVPYNSYPTQLGTFKSFNVDGFEAGADFGLFKNKISTSFSYFSNRESYDGFNGLEKYYRKGWEMDIQYFPVKNKDFTYQVGLLLSSWKSRLATNWIGVDENFSNPSWRNSLLNQLYWKDFTFICIIESLKDNTVFNESTLKLRDISLGYTLPAKFFEKLGLDVVLLSVSGRNLYKTSGSDEQMENLTGAFIPFQKSYTINLKVVF